ncbi:type I 3-dehydroquinate dehydratase [Halorhabdus sp. CBA1104]|uniref:type I 3-dehydroquinate dehydratase n=1 Tax=unclassified Halorhabdus TaxID=2621901 RepID=UPI0012B1A611|nr:MULTISPECIES: type I 3-dehydroquinate dehydratase [unclassified Halorhabdus]QGN07511.1 type I 3-dehydroquinate dehydratase [Halorhabdus sp. CBA1104]
MDFTSFRLAAATAELDSEPDAREHADLIELRMDLADEPLSQLSAYGGELPVLVTNRPTWEGGEAEADGRLTALEAAITDDAVGAVDVELATAREGEADRLIQTASEHDVSVIVSAHDFEATPSMGELQETLRAACEYGDVGKLAVTATSPDDVLDLLVATRAATVEGHTVATMAMGEAGRHSRAVAPIYGSKIGYAPVDPAEATAPGQYDLATLSTLVEQLSEAD